MIEKNQNSDCLWWGQSWLGRSRRELSLFFSRFFWHGPFLKSLLNLFQYCFCFTFWCFGWKAGGVLAHWPAVEPAHPALEGVLTTALPRTSLPWFLNHTFWCFSFPKPAKKWPCSRNSVLYITGIWNTSPSLNNNQNNNNIDCFLGVLHIWHHLFLVTLLWVCFYYYTNFIG